MRRIRYLSTLALLFCILPIFGQNDFDPVSPDEPGQPIFPKRLVLLSSPDNGGTTNGSGKYTPGQNVRIRAYSNSGFVFSHWSDTKGKLVSQQNEFSLLQGEKSDTLIANFRFSPGSPAEPKEPALTQYFHLAIGQVEGGSGYGGGKYLSGSSVNIYCYPNEGFVFCGWYNPKNELVSKESSFQYVTTAENETLIPCFEFSPGSPEEPPVPVLSHNIKLEAGEGGTVSAGSYRMKEGSSTKIYANSNTGYQFVQWLKDGQPYTALKDFNYTMESKNTTFKAEFKFNPGSPAEPSMPEGKHQYTYYLMSKIAKPETTVEYPIYITTLDTACDMSFQLTFSKLMKPDLQSVLLSQKMSQYKVSYVASSDTSYVFSFVGSRLLPTNTMMLKFSIPISKGITTGISHQVKINQVTVSKTDGSRTTASTRNGRIYVFENGDTNGDGSVDVFDMQNMSLHILHQTPQNFIIEVSDVNSDHDLDIFDCQGIAKIIIGTNK